MITLNRDYIAENMPARPDNAHKGTMGTLCSVTGRTGCSGAAIMSAKAALRCGVGLHYQALPESIYPIFASAVHESVCFPLKGSRYGFISPDDAQAVLNIAGQSSALLIGCGLGNTPDTRKALYEILLGISIPAVVDADGINGLAMNIDILNEIKAPLILTPHVKEFSRLTGLGVEYIIKDQEQAAYDFSTAHPGVTLVLKSHRTVIAHNGEMYLNTAGNSGMAKGGSGDVLAGIIASLAAQGAEPLKAAAMGVHIHALAGDIAAERLGRTAMLPSDIIDALSEVFRSIGR